jgi:Flp pilus assembly pilin Flp
MDRTQTGATVVLVMKRPRRKSGQALIEYAFLLVLLAGITLAVLVLAGNQLQGTFNDVSYEFSHLTDTNTLAPDGTTLGPGATPPASECPTGQSPQLRGHKWKCR